MRRDAFKPGCFAQTIFTISAYLLYSLTLGSRNGPAPSGTDWLIFGGIALVLHLLGTREAESDRGDGRKDADARATWVLKNAVAAARRGLTLSATLYLRPFELTNKLWYQNPDYGGPMTPSGQAESSQIDLETLIAAELSKKNDLITLGEPGEHVGAGRLATTEEEWQEIVQLLARACRRVLVLPSGNPGTRWEIEWLLGSDLLENCVFLMPSKPATTPVDIVQYWSSTSTQLQEIRVTLPAYQPNGMLFTLCREGTVLKEVAMHMNRGASFLKKIEQFSVSPRTHAREITAPLHPGIAPPPAGAGGSPMRARAFRAAGANLDEISPPPERLKHKSLPYVVIMLVFIVVSFLFWWLS